MPTYKVTVNIKGVVVVAAESPEEAKIIARLCQPQLNGKPVYNAETSVQAVEQVDAYSLQPDNVSQDSKVTMN